MFIELLVSQSLGNSQLLRTKEHSDKVSNKASEQNVTKMKVLHILQTMINGKNIGLRTVLRNLASV